jgi:hypothetical protein
MQEEISLNIRNNRPYPQKISVLGSPVNPLDTSNALTEYRWNISSFVATASDILTLQYRNKNSAIFSTFTFSLSNPSGQQLANALNQLGIGYFNYYTELGQNYLSTNNDDYVFSDLGISSTLFYSVFIKVKETAPTGVILQIASLGIYTNIGSPTSYVTGASNVAVGTNIVIYLGIFASGINPQYGVGQNGAYTGRCGSNPYDITPFNDVYLNVNAISNNYVPC